MIPSNKHTINQETDNYCDILPFVNNYFTQAEPLKLTAREFCRLIYNLAKLPEVEILKAEMEPQYRKRCIGILSKTLNVSRQAVLNWGSGLDFPHMPVYHQRFLGLYWERYELFLEIQRLRRFSA